jgi:hypothetical protein
MKEPDKRENVADIGSMEEAGRLAQEISFAFEDWYHDKDKMRIFHALFNRYLLPVDPGEQMEPYDAIITLWRKNRSEFREHKLI